MPNGKEGAGAHTTTTFNELRWAYYSVPPTVKKQLDGAPDGA